MPLLELTDRLLLVCLTETILIDRLLMLILTAEYLPVSVFTGSLLFLRSRPLSEDVNNL